MTIKKLSLLAAFALFATPVFAGSSAWFDADGARIRLISLPGADGKTINAGLQIDLKKGWKTYWRSPGGSGLPPQISFIGSKNIASTKMDFPIPSTFGAAQNLTVGYDEPVTFPIAVEPLFANRPVTLNASGVLGICEEICVPIQFQLSLTEDGKGFSTPDIAGALFQARQKMPTPKRDDFHVSSAQVEEKSLRVAANVPKGTRESVLIVEGPSDWYLIPTKAHAIIDGKAHFSVDLKSVPQNASPHETMLKFTLLSDETGIEQDLMPTKK